jgi:hypothetical protein
MISDVELDSRFRAAFSLAADIASCAYIHSRLKNGIYPVADKTWADLVLTNTENGKKYKMANGKLTERLPGVLCPAPMVSFTRTKNIVKTAIDNSDFEVVESFGLKAWDITIEGLIIDMDNHELPYADMQTFREIFEANNTFTVESDLFYTLGINEIYFDKIEEFSVLKDYQDTAKFKLKALSIKPLEYFLN